MLAWEDLARVASKNSFEALSPWARHFTLERRRWPVSFHDSNCDSSSVAASRVACASRSVGASYKQVCAAVSCRRRSASVAR
jgi:hypothetical protein